jgi:hypothetical protein
MATQNNFIVKNGIVVATTATFQSTAISTSTTTGAVIITGGVGIGGNMYVGGAITATNVYVNGSPVITQATAVGVNSLNGASGTVTISAGTDTAIGVSGTSITIWNTSTLQSVTNRGAVTTNQVTLNNGLVLGSTGNPPILMAGSYANIIPGFISAVGTLVGTTETNKIYISNYQHILAPVSTTTINAFYGYLMIPTLANTATYSIMYGVFSRIDMNAASTTGSVAAWYGFSSENPIRDAASDVRFANHYGFRAADPNSITATNVYGYASQIVSSTVSNRWNIYASGTAPNLLYGQVRIGTTATYSGEKLSVNGNAYINGVLTATQSIYATGVVYSAVGSDGLVALGGDPAGNITLGNPNRTIAGAPYIDFHSSTSTNDYDSRIIATGGGTTGSGILQINASKLLISSTSSSTSTITGALVVNGGVGIGGNLYVANTSYIAGAQIVTTATIANYASVGASSTGTTSTFFINNSTPSTSTTTGALVVTGGVGIGGNIYVGGTTSSFIGNVGIGTVSPTWRVDVNLGTIDGTSTSTGGYNITGDAGTAAGYTTYNMQLNNSRANASGYMRLARTTGTEYLGMQIASQSRDGIAFLTAPTTATNTLVEQVRISASGTVTISTATNSTSTTTGALQVVGGVGIGGALYAASINAVSSYNGTTASVALSLSNSYGNSTGTWFLPYASSGSFNPTTQNGDSAIIFHGLTNGAGSALNIAPWSNTATGVRITNLGVVTIASTASSTSTNIGALIVAGGVGIGGTLNVANTSYIAGAQVITTATIGQYAAAGASTGTTSTFLINNATISTGTNSGALQVVGGVGVGGNVYVGGNINIALGQYATFGSNTSTRITRDGALNGLDLQTFATSRLFIADTDGAVTIRSTAISTSTMTGALVVKGGAGIGGNVYISGTSYVNNSQILTSATIYSYTALRGQYIPRTAYVSTGTITIDASQYDTYVVTATNASSVIIQINTDNGYTPFDGQKLIIRLTDDGTARRLYFNYNSNHFRTVGIAPPAITLSNNTIYVGAMYNQSVARWDILSAVIQ